MNRPSLKFNLALVFAVLLGAAGCAHQSTQIDESRKCGLVPGQLAAGCLAWSDGTAPVAEGHLPPLGAGVLPKSGRYAARGSRTLCTNRADCP